MALRGRAQGVAASRGRDRPADLQDDDLLGEGQIDRDTPLKRFFRSELFKVPEEYKLRDRSAK